MKSFVAFIITSMFAISMCALPKLAQAGNLFESIKQAGLLTIGSDAYQYSNPDNPKTPQYIVADAIQIALTFLGIIFLAFIVFAGFRWMTAGGNEDRVVGARGLILNAVIGIIIVLAAYAITYFVLDKALRATVEGQDYELDL